RSYSKRCSSIHVHHGMCWTTGSTQGMSSSAEVVLGASRSHCSYSLVLRGTQKPGGHPLVLRIVSSVLFFAFRKALGYFGLYCCDVSVVSALPRINILRCDSVRSAFFVCPLHRLASNLKFQLAP
ncbi:unnamed protein product, partial [Hapterophycus canaliculatus]